MDYTARPHRRLQRLRNVVERVSARQRKPTTPTAVHVSTRAPPSAAAEDSHAFGAILQRLRPFRRQRHVVIEGGVDVLLPYLPRQLVEQLDRVAVGIADIQAVGHAMLD